VTPPSLQTFICNKLKCYLNWLGHETKHINVGSYRRQQKPQGQMQSATFFDSNNPVGRQAVSECMTGSNGEPCSCTTPQPCAVHDLP
jgi:hypothetical protein